MYRKKSSVPVTFPVAYQKERLAQAKAGAAELRYAEGVAYAEQGSRKAWREAHQRFVKALIYVPGYRDAEARAGEARELGSDKVLVLPFNASSAGGISGDFGVFSKGDTLSTLVGKYLSTLAKGETMSSELATFFYNSYLSTIVAEAGKQQYVRVVERSVIEDLLREREIAVSALADGRVKLESLGIQGANIIVFGQISGVMYEQPRETSKTVTLQAIVEQPVPGAAPVNGVVPQEKVTVYATVTLHTKTSSLTAGFSLRAVNVENSLLVDVVSKTQTVRDTKEWAEYSGDKRALTDTYVHLTEKREESVRNPREMMSELATELIPSAIRSLLQKLPLE